MLDENGKGVPHLQL